MSVLPDLDPVGRDQLRVALALLERHLAPVGIGLAPALADLRDELDRQREAATMRTPEPTHGVPLRPTVNHESSRLPLSRSGVDDGGMTTSRLLTRKAAAERAGISVATIDRRIASGDLAVVRVSARCIRLDVDDVDRLMETYQ
jgi:hypothetical protein